MVSTTRKIFSLKTAGAAGVCILLLSGFLFYFLYHHPDPQITDLKAATFSKLKKVREAKKKEILRYFAEARELASAIRRDDRMVGHFLKLRAERSLLTHSVEFDIDQRYVTKYGVFYDILFLDEKGNVFHSVKQEADLGSNLLNGPLSGSAIGRQLRIIDTQNLFVDFEYYQPSDEPASFYIVAVSDGDKHLGWFVLQLPINEINAILHDYKGLGRTGEVYLVNRKALMLSESRFIPDGTILKQRVDTLAVKAAAREGVGDRIILDYRGIRVFSSYEAFKTGDATWIIIAEIDEDEIVTEYYKANKNTLENKLLEHLSIDRNHKRLSGYPGGEYKRVDLNEFAQCDSQGRLATFGVATCTAVAITFTGQFGYLAHISPTSLIYANKGTLGIFRGRSMGNDFLGGLIRRIRHYQVFPYQLKRLKFTLIAPHKASFGRAIDTILDHGLELSNIKIIHNHQARSANVILDMSMESVVVGWNIKGSTPIFDSASHIDNLGGIVMKLIGYRS